MDYANLFRTTKNKSQSSNNEEFLLYKAGFLEPIGDGLNFFLPLGWKVLRKIAAIIRQELDSIDGQEIRMPFVMPYSYLEKSARAEIFAKELGIFQNNQGETYVLPPAREEAISEFVKNSNYNNWSSPLVLYEIQSQYRDINTTTNHLLESKESLRGEVWSFHLSDTSLNNFIPKIFSTFTTIFNRCGIEFNKGLGSTEFSGATNAFEFFVDSTHGNQQILCCPNCGYCANKTIAQAIPHLRSDNPLEAKKIFLKGISSPQDVRQQLKVGLDEIANAVVYKAMGNFYMAVIRADYEISEIKLARYLKVPSVTQATAKELEKLDLVFESLSPMNLPAKAANNLTILIDETIANSSNLIYGTNESDYYYQNGNFGVDYESEFITDMAMVHSHDLCKQCGTPLAKKQAIEFAKIYKIGSFFSNQLHVTTLNKKGKETLLQIGSYYIDLNRLLLAIAEKNNDEQGLVWPFAIAPYLYYLINEGDSLSLIRATKEIYSSIKDITIFDQTSVSLEEKKKQAALLGIPYQIILTDSLIKDGKITIIERKGLLSHTLLLADFLENLNLLSSGVDPKETSLLKEEKNAN